MSAPQENAAQRAVLETPGDADQDTVLETPGDADQDTILETPQMNMNQGIKMFGKAGVEAVKWEMQQLHNRK